MHLNSESPETSALTITAWSVSSALIVGLAGFVAWIVTFAWLSTFAMAALRTWLTFGEAEASIVIIVTALTGAAGYLAARLCSASRAQGFLRSISWRFCVGQGVVCLLLGICTTMVMHLVNTGTLPTRVAILNGGGFRLFALMCIGVLFAGPFVEEVYFRGILFAGLSSKLGPFWSIGIVTLVSDLGHPQHRWIVLPIAILLGVVRLRTASVANCFVLHAAYNLGVILWGVR
jgi:membrane protease YdiL (CAAX protease family)